MPFSVAIAMDEAFKYGAHQTVRIGGRALVGGRPEAAGHHCGTTWPHSGQGKCGILRREGKCRIGQSHRRAGVLLPWMCYIWAHWLFLILKKFCTCLGNPPNLSLHLSKLEQCGEIANRHMLFTLTVNFIACSTVLFSHGLPLQNAWGGGGHLFESVPLSNLSITWKY